MRIGILGGTFDPIHNGHLGIARTALKECGLQKVVFVPCGIPPHKSIEDVSDSKDRFQMVWRGVKDESFLECSDYEIQQNRPNYTIDTIRHFRQKIAKKDLFFIIGADSLYDLHSWKEIDELVTMCEFVIVVRKGFSLENITAEEVQLKENSFAVCMKNAIIMEPVAIAASDIRQRVASGESIAELVPESVREYILENRLYINREV